MEDSKKRDKFSIKRPVILGACLVSFIALSFFGYKVWLRSKMEWLFQNGYYAIVSEMFVTHQSFVSLNHENCSVFLKSMIHTNQIDRLDLALQFCKLNGIELPEMVLAQSLVFFERHHIDSAKQTLFAGFEKYQNNLEILVRITDFLEATNNDLRETAYFYNKLMHNAIEAAKEGKNQKHLLIKAFNFMFKHKFYQQTTPAVVQLLRDDDLDAETFLKLTRSCLNTSLREFATQFLGKAKAKLAQYPEHISAPLRDKYRDAFALKSEEELASLPANMSGRNDDPFLQEIKKHEEERRRRKKP